MKWAKDKASSPPAFALGGLATPVDVDDVWARMTLLVPELGLSPEAAALRAQYESHYGLDKLPTVLTHSASTGAETCIRRFAQVESDVHNAGLRGIGRLTAEAFPRLGGVLQSSDLSSGAAATLQAAVERTMHAGYLVCVSTNQHLEAPVTVSDPEAVWSKWVTIAYDTPAGLWDYVNDTAAVWQFWDLVLERLGLPKQAKALRTNPRASITSSLSGLATAGSMLAYAERR